MVLYLSNPSSYIWETFSPRIGTWLMREGLQSQSPRILHTIQMLTTGLKEKENENKRISRKTDKEQKKLMKSVRLRILLEIVPSWSLSMLSTKSSLHLETDKYPIT